MTTNTNVLAIVTRLRTLIAEEGDQLPWEAFSYNVYGWAPEVHIHISREAGTWEQRCAMVDQLAAIWQTGPAAFSTHKATGTKFYSIDSGPDWRAFTARDPHTDANSDHEGEAA
jgi:hypothetical protein